MNNSREQAGLSATAVDATSITDIKEQIEIMIDQGQLLGYYYFRDEIKDVIAAIVAFTGDWPEAVKVWRLVMDEAKRVDGVYSIMQCWWRVRVPLLQALIDKATLTTPTA